MIASNAASPVSLRLLVSEMIWKGGGALLPPFPVNGVQLRPQSMPGEPWPVGEGWDAAPIDLSETAPEALGGSRSNSAELMEHSLRRLCHFLTGSDRSHSYDELRVMKRNNLRQFFTEIMISAI